MTIVLEEYFREYNATITRLQLNSQLEINTNNGLVGILESIDKLRISEGEQGLAAYQRWLSRSARESFCRQVVYYHIDNAEVPNIATNVLSIDQNMSFGAITSTFNELANRIKSLRNILEIKQTS